VLLVVALGLMATLTAACSSSGTGASSARTGATAPASAAGSGVVSPPPASPSFTGPVPAGPASGHPRVFAYYYLWWSHKHWQDSLGASYPYSAATLPLPADLDADGCAPRPKFAGVTVTDVPERLYSQDDPGVIAADVRRAAQAGLAGFAVNWIGTGMTNQQVADSQYTRRLQSTVDAVHALNAAGGHFSLWLSYKASVNVLPVDQIVNDLTWFQRTYGNDPAFDHTATPKITVIWNGSRKYPLDALRTVSQAVRGRLRVLGDETTWSAQRAPYLDGDAYYWSSQNPYANPKSFSQLGRLATDVRAGGRNPDGSAKVFVSPVIPGYDKSLIGGTACVPRRGGNTVRTLFAGNLAATHPDAWALISWNEITEGTYVTPMRRYGSQDLDALADVISTTTTG
jgi:hypothetical protein